MVSVESVWLAGDGPLLTVDAGREFGWSRTSVVAGLLGGLALGGCKT